MLSSRVAVIVEADATMRPQEFRPYHSTRLRTTLAEHWPEYLIEAWALGMFMLSACAFTVWIEHPHSWIRMAISDGNVRRLLSGIAMGCTAIAIIYSPWGKRSGAHMNPSVTLSFLRLQKIAPLDAFFYIIAQFVGGLCGVLLSLALFGSALSAPEVNFAITTPGQYTPWVAMVAEIVISFLMMTMVLRVSNSNRLQSFTGIFAGLLVATFITLEAPFSGMSMNPARSFASALPAHMWPHFWIYLVSPVLAMQLAVSVHRWKRNRSDVHCAKLIHENTQRCIHCGYEPAPKSS